MLHSLELRNFGPHEHVELDFTSGTNLIVAPNGAGKSNLVYGVGWAIQGAKSLPTEYTQKDIIRDGTDFVSATCVVDILGERHTFFRKFDGKSVTAEVHVNGQQVANSASGVETYLQQIGLDVSAFSVLCSRQRDLEAFIHATPAARKSLFDALLRIEIIDAARKEAKKQADDHGKTVGTDEEVSIENAEVDVENKVKALSDHQQLLDDWREDLAELDKTVESLRPDPEQTSARQVVAREVEDLERQIERAKARMEEIDGMFEAELASLDTLRELRVEAEEAVEELRSKIADVEAGIKAGSRRLHEIAGERAALDDLSNACQPGKPCPLCTSVVERNVRIVVDVHRQDEYKQIADAIDGANYDLETLKQETANKLYELNEIKSAIADAQDRERLREERKTVDALWQDFEEKYADAVQRLNSMPQPPDLTELYAAMQEQSTAQKMVYQLEGKVKFAELDLQEAQKRYNHIKGRADQIKEASKLHRDYKQTTKALAEFREYVLHQALEWVSNRMTTIMHEFGTFPEITEGSCLMLDSKLHFYFMSNDVKIPVYRFSGGQKSVFSIFLRVALSDYLSDRLGMHGMLLLDAVLDSVDADNAAAAARVLDALGPQQAIILSHFDVPELDANRITI